MNNTLIIYHSKYGHTKQYAQWLAEELKADMCEAKSLKNNMLNDYSTILFGNGIYAGTNKAANLIVKHFEQIKDKKVVLFTCGLNDVSKETIIIKINKALDKVITPEIREKIKIFHVRGGIDYGNMGFLYKTMMKMVHSQLSKKPENELDDENKTVLETYGKKVDFSDKKMLEPIIEYCLQK
jgi:menaquinone-dependent protoporphyrinogen IX oxidase